MNRWFTVAFVVIVLTASVIVFHRSVRASAKTDTILYYVDPMHPGYRSDRPGKAPDCGMDLVPVLAKSQTTTRAVSDGIRIGAAEKGQYGIDVVVVRPGVNRAAVLTFGKVSVDETRIYRVNMGTDGYVKSVSGDSVGAHVKKDQRLAVLYSPDFLAVTGGYLSANDRTSSVAGSSVPASAQNTASAQARADRLRNLGMSDAQIEEIKTTRKIPEDVYIASPVDGFITARNITPGLRVERNTDLYTVADLSRVWVMADVFDSELDTMRPGTKVHIVRPNTQEAWTGTIDDALPQLDPISHASKVRINVKNPGYRLRPEMLVNVYFATAHTRSLEIPIDAVIDTGRSKQVFVEGTDGVFYPRIVTTGHSFEDSVQVLAGLEEGETIARSGAFLIDSESRLRSSESEPVLQVAKAHPYSPGMHP